MRCALASGGAPTRSPRPLCDAVLTPSFLANVFGESVSLKTARDTLVPLELAQHAQMVYSKR